MAGLPLEKLPTVAAAAWLSLRDELQRILRDDLVAMWAHGGTTSVDDPPHAADLDTYVILARRPDEASVRAIDEVHDGTAHDHGVEWDAWYVLAEDAARSDPPHHAFRDDRRDTSWAINRAYWLAGRYVSLYGPEPAEVVPPPSWDELEDELSRELEHIERHVVEGDTDRYEATYAILNGSRILHAVENHSVVISKRSAGAWALEHLPARWHAVLRTAVRSYEGQATPADEQLLADEMPEFVAFVRDGLPVSADAPAGTVPRWSGY